MCEICSHTILDFFFLYLSFFLSFYDVFVFCLISVVSFVFIFWDLFCFHTFFSFLCFVLYVLSSFHSFIFIWLLPK